MAQTSKSDFSYMRKPATSVSMSEHPLTVEPPVITSPRADVNTPVQPAPKTDRGKREKYTTSMLPDVRDAMEHELTRLRREGNRRSAADLIEELIVEWLAKRRQHV